LPKSKTGHEGRQVILLRFAEIDAASSWAIFLGNTPFLKTITTAFSAFLLMVGGTALPSVPMLAATFSRCYHRLLCSMPPHYPPGID